MMVSPLKMKFWERFMEDLETKRPLLPTDILEGIVSDAEEFQNLVLRPVIKMKSDLLMTHIAFKLKSLKVDWLRLSPVKQRKSLTSLMTKDQAFKNEIVGIVVGYFEFEEYYKYAVIQKETNRRITQIVLNRAIDILVNSSIDRTWQNNQK
jgi:hypothetical protein